MTTKEAIPSGFREKCISICPINNQRTGHHYVILLQLHRALRQAEDDMKTDLAPNFGWGW